MIHFLDGPLQMVKLNGFRTPVMLRVVRGDDGRWDMLNEVDDVARDDEEILVYRMEGAPSRMHILRSVGGRRRGEWIVEAFYRMLPKQPGDQHTRRNEDWSAWCEANRAELSKGLQVKVEEPTQPERTQP